MGLKPLELRFLKYDGLVYREQKALDGGPKPFGTEIIDLVIFEPTGNTYTSQELGTPRIESLDALYNSPGAVANIHKMPGETHCLINSRSGWESDNNFGLDGVIFSYYTINNT